MPLDGLLAEHAVHEGARLFLGIAQRQNNQRQAQLCDCAVNRGALYSLIETLQKGPDRFIKVCYELCAR